MKYEKNSILKWKQHVSPKNSYLFTTLHSVISQNEILRLNKHFEINVSLQDLPRCYDTHQHQKKSTGHGVAHLAETLHYKLESRGSIPDYVIGIFH